MMKIVGDWWFRQSSATEGGPRCRSFFLTPVSFGFLFVFLFTVCLCNAQLLLDYWLA
jgi:hypothetical protein